MLFAISRFAIERVDCIFLYINKINIKLNLLKKELENNKIKISKYNKKHAIFEYLKWLNKCNNSKINASLNITQMVFINDEV